MKRVIAWVVLALLSCGIAQAQTSTGLYVATQAGDLYLFDVGVARQLVRGTTGNDTSDAFTTGVLDSTIAAGGTAQATCLASGLRTDGTTGLYIGTDQGNCYALGENLQQRNMWDTDGPGAQNPVTAVAFGDYAGTPRLFVARLGGTAPENALILLGTEECHGGGYINHWANGGPGDVTGIALADVEPNIPGGEAIFTVHDTTFGTKASHLFCFIDLTSKGLGTLEFLFDPYNTGNYGSDVFAADLDPSLGVGAEFGLVGCTPDGETGAFGEGALAYYSYWDESTPGAVDFYWWANLDLGSPQDDTVVDVAVADVFGDAGPEIVMVGDSKVFINDGNPAGTGVGANRLQTIETNQPCTHVAVGDVFGDDGVDEIVVGTASGLLLIYEHDDPADLDSPFIIDQDSGAVVDMGGTSVVIAGLAVEPYTPACVPPGPWDFNNDCVVDLLDFAVFAQHWLEDTRI